jgi:hypothetical protein
MFFSAIITGYLYPGVVFAENDRLDVGKFSAIDDTDKLPAGWEPLYFKKIKEHTVYESTEDESIMVIRAESRASSSGLIRKIDIDPEKYPVITWRWKITNTYEKGDVTQKQGDDYPARIYVTFAYDPEHVGLFERAKFKTAKLLYGEYPPVAALNYIWASRAKKGTIVANPYTKRAMMIVVESGDAEKNKWLQEERNILEDFKMAFGTNPPRISGVAIMTDSDNTKESAITYYGDIVFKQIEP